MAKVLKNFMEELVLQKLDKNIEHFQVCKCDQCRMDIAAMALNELPPKYVVSDQGEVYTRLSFTQTQYEIDIMKALAKAAEVVKTFPSHDK